MNAHHDKPFVFWAEADDDALRITRDENLPRMALLAYLLLDNQIVIHPAYVWQSEKTNQIVIPDNNTFLQPPHVKLFLGDSKSVREYINDRMSKLRPLEASNNMLHSELDQYKRHGSKLDYEVAKLDDRFGDSSGLSQIKWSRDKKFRDLIRCDILNNAPLGPHLGALIPLCNAVLSTLQIRSLKNRLIDMTQDPNQLVSCDSITGYLIDNNFRKDRIDPIFDRLHVLHWQAHEGSGLVVPLLNRLNYSRLDSNDPVVFWVVINSFFCTDLKNALLRASWEDCSKFVDDLRHDVLWKQFVTIYREIVQIIDSDDEDYSTRIISKKLTAKYPTLINAVATNAPVSKLGLLSIVCTILGFSLDMGVISWGGTVGTLGDALNIYLQTAKAHYGSGREALKSRIDVLTQQYLS